MSTSIRLFVPAAAISLLAATIFAIGCRDRSTQRSLSNPAQVERDVKDMLDRWVHAFESRDSDAVRSVLAGDDRFIWLEDGERRYQSAEDVVRALAGFPRGLTISHALRDVRIIPISDDAAWAELATSTRIQQNAHVVSDFASVVLMVAQRDRSGWRITAAHTSSTKPRSLPPG